MVGGQGKGYAVGVGISIFIAKPIEKHGFPANLVINYMHYEHLSFRGYRVSEKY